MTAAVSAGAAGLAGARRAASRHPLGAAGTVILVGYVAFCWLGPVFYHSNQLQGNLLGIDLPPGPGHPLGTDQNGFDELGRLMKGGQAALEIAFLAALIATAVGTLYGAVAGLAGGLLDGVLMRVLDVMLAIPFLFVVLVVASSGRAASVPVLGWLIGMFSWLVPARLVRGEVLSLRRRDFVVAGDMMGLSRRRQVLRHLLPNALGVVAVNVAFQVADAVIALSLLGFLGFGLSYPNVDWGDMLAQANTAISNGYWWLVFPVGASLTLVAMACHFIGEAVRDALDAGVRR